MGTLAANAQQGPIYEKANICGCLMECHPPGAPACSTYYLCTIFPGHLGHEILQQLQDLSFMVATLKLAAGIWSRGKALI